jgi:hypothetical protein
LRMRTMCSVCLNVIGIGLRIYSLLASLKLNREPLGSS